MANQGDHGIQLVQRPAQSLENVGPRLRLSQLEAAPADDHLEPVVEERLQHPPQAEDHGPVVLQGQEVRPKGGLHLRVLVQLIQNHPRLGVAPQLNDHPHAAPIGLIAEVGDAGDLPVLHKTGDLLDHRRLVHLIRNLGDDDGFLAVLQRVDLSSSPHHDEPAAGGVGVADALPPEDNPPGGKVGARQETHQPLNGGLG